MSNKTGAETVPPVGKVVADLYLSVPKPEIVPESVKVAGTVTIWPVLMLKVPTEFKILETVKVLEAAAVAVEEAVRL